VSHIRDSDIHTSPYHRNMSKYHSDYYRMHFTATM
jgi:hypothetical protein